MVSLLLSYKVRNIKFLANISKISFGQDIITWLHDLGFINIVCKSLQAILHLVLSNYIKISKQFYIQLC